MWEAQYLKTDTALGGSYQFPAATRHEARAQAKMVQRAFNYGTLLRLEKVKTA